MNVTQPLVQGDTLNFTITPVDVQTGLPVSLDDAADIVVKVSPAGTRTIALEKDFSDGVEVIQYQGSDAIFFSIATDESSELLGRYFYEAEVTQDNGDVFTVRNRNSLPGSFTIIEDSI